MFIAHGEWLRKYSKWILAAVLLLLIPGFIALFTTTSGTPGRTQNLPTIRGKAINPLVFQRAEEAVRASYIVSMGQVPRSAEFADQTRQEAVLRIILLKKAEEFNVRVSDEDVGKYLRNQPLFQNEQRQFDPERFNRFRVMLNNFGISEPQYEEMLRDQIVIGRLRNLVAAGAKATPRALVAAYAPPHEKIQVDLVRLKVADNKEPVAVTDKDALEFYEQNKKSFREPAQVKVRYALVTTAEGKKNVKVTDEELLEYYGRNELKYAGDAKESKPLAAVKDKVRDDLLAERGQRWAGDRATELSVKLVTEPGAPRPDFAKIAGEFGLTLKETGFFSQGDKVEGVEGAPAFTQTAMSLAADAPHSDPVPGKEGYYVLEFVAGKPSEIPPFDKVKDKAIEQVKRMRTYDATVKRGIELTGKVKELMGKGKTFDAACTELGLKIETPAAFTTSDEKPPFPEVMQIGPIALSMAVHEVSRFIPANDGGLFFHLKSRTQPDPKDYEKDKDAITREVVERASQQLWQDWLSAVVRQEQVDFKMPPRPQAPVETDDEPAPTS